MQGRTVRKCMVEGPKVRGVGKKGNSKMGGWTGKKVRGGGKEGERGRGGVLWHFRAQALEDLWSCSFL